MYCMCARGRENHDLGHSGDILQSSIAVARLGGSTAPLAAYTWTRPPNPRADGETIIAPQWSLNVLTDGSVDPFMPDSIRFRDGDLIRPVCPFIELWARMGKTGSDPSTWNDVPLTPALLAKLGMDESALLFRIEARNAKAARRRNDPNQIDQGHCVNPGALTALWQERNARCQRDHVVF